MGGCSDNFACHFFSAGGFTTVVLFSVFFSAGGFTTVVSFFSTFSTTGGAVLIRASHPTKERLKARIDERAILFITSKSHRNPCRMFFPQFPGRHIVFGASQASMAFTRHDATVAVPISIFWFDQGRVGSVTGFPFTSVALLLPIHLWSAHCGPRYKVPPGRSLMPGPGKLVR